MYHKGIDDRVYAVGGFCRFINPYGNRFYISLFKSGENGFAVVFFKWKLASLVSILMVHTTAILDQSGGVLYRSSKNDMWKLELSQKRSLSLGPTESKSF